jgi:hypothetical protein
MIGMHRSGDFGFPPVPFEELVNGLNTDATPHKGIEVVV